MSFFKENYHTIRELLFYYFTLRGDVSGGRHSKKERLFWGPKKLAEIPLGPGRVISFGVGKRGGRMNKGDRFGGGVVLEGGQHFLGCSKEEPGKLMITCHNKTAPLPVKKWQLPKDKHILRYKLRRCDVFWTSCNQWVTSEPGIRPCQQCHQHDQTISGLLKPNLIEVTWCVDILWGQDTPG